MRIYYAPLEGITGYIYRNIYNKYYGNGKIEKYFSPFIAPGVNQVLSRKEMRDILPQNNEGIRLIPQVLGSRAEDILLAMNDISDLGYDEININLGCPSGTVVAKKKGSGFLAFPEELDEFLYKVYESAKVKVSVKTRIGKESPDEFFRLLEIYNKYQMEELIIHPRVQKDFYKNTPNMEIFEHAAANSKNKLCYNGDIVDISSYNNVVGRFLEKIDSVMIGRGFLVNPKLVDELTEQNDRPDTKRLLDFHDELLEAYANEMSGERPVLFKMKELWAYLGSDFPGCEKELKKIRKCENLRSYKEIAHSVIKSRD